MKIHGEGIANKSESGQILDVYFPNIEFDNQKTEFKTIKNICKGMEIITPGVRLKGEKYNGGFKIAYVKDMNGNAMASDYTWTFTINDTDTYGGSR